MRVTNAHVRVRACVCVCDSRGWGPRATRATLTGLKALVGLVAERQLVDEVVCLGAQLRQLCVAVADLDLGHLQLPRHCPRLAVAAAKAEVACVCVCVERWRVGAGR